MHSALAEAAAPARLTRFCRDLTHELVAHLPELSFELDREEVLAWLAARR